MKKWLLILPLFCACYSNRPLMTADEFASIPIGSTTAQVRQEYGEPYAIYSRGGNTDEWEYIERLDVGAYVVNQRHYFLIITNGKVVGKRTDLQRPPPYLPTQTDDPFPHNS